MPRTKDVLLSYNDIMKDLKNEIANQRQELKYQVAQKNYSAATETDGVLEGLEFAVDIIIGLRISKEGDI